MLAKVSWKDHFLKALFPLLTAFLLTLFALFMYVTGYGYELDALILRLHHFFYDYGLIALFIAAFLEGIYMVNLYFPGSLVIVAAVLFSSHTLPELTVITCICWFSFMAATVVNYFLGYAGLYRFFHFLGAKGMLVDTHKWLNKHGWWAMFLSAFHPNYLAISSVCMGIGKEGVVKTLLLAGLSMMVTGPILTFLTATFSDTFTQESDTLFYLMIALFYLWGAYLFTKGVLRDFYRSSARLTLSTN